MGFVAGSFGSDDDLRVTKMTIGLAITTSTLSEGSFCHNDCTICPQTPFSVVGLRGCWVLGLKQHRTTQQKRGFRFWWL